MRHSLHPTHCFNVEIEQQGQAITQAMARNISLEGMLLESNSASQQTGAKIQLACLVNDINWHIDATVIHANSTGLGVKFNRPQPRLVKALTAGLESQTQPISGRFSLA
jgi:hypothetical protein